MAMLYFYKVEVQTTEGMWSLRSVHKTWSVAERIQKDLIKKGIVARVISKAIPMYTKTVVQ